MFYKYSCIRVSLLLVTLVFMHTSSASSVHSSQLNTGDIERFEIDPSNQYVVYNEFDLKGELNRFSSLLIEKSNAVKIANSINTRNENRFWIEPENLKVLHQAASETTIISTAIEGDNSPTILSSFSPSEPSGELQSINKLVVSDDSNLVYFSTLEGGLYKTPSNGEAPATDLVSGMTVDRFSLSPNQEFIVFSTNSDHRQIFFVPTLGDTPPVFLANLPEAIAINNLSISPDNEKILFTVEFLDRNPTQIQLFSIALNAQPALRALSDPLIGNDIAMRFKIIPHLIETRKLGSYFQAPLTKPHHQFYSILRLKFMISNSTRLNNRLCIHEQSLKTKSVFSMVMNLLLPTLWILPVLI